MSSEKYTQEATRWFKQAIADIKAAQTCSVSGSYEWACFQSQQAGEKLLKALWFAVGADPWGHSLTKLIDDFPKQEIRENLLLLETHAKRLDKLYIPTRYPNGLPELTPAEIYTNDDASLAISSVCEIRTSIEKILYALEVIHSPDS